MDLRTCFIGGERYSQENVEEYMRQLDRSHTIVTGDGSGAEERVRLVASRRGFRMLIPPLQLSLFASGQLGRKQALQLQVVDVYVQALLGGRLVLVGRGRRVDEARAMLERSSAWPMEVDEL